MSAVTFLWILFLASGALLMGISIPLIRGRVGQNPWYGFRVRRTLEDPKVWYAVNAYSGRRLFGAGVAEAVVATALYWLADLDVAVYASIVGAVAIGGLAFGLIQSFRYLRQWTKEEAAPTG